MENFKFPRNIPHFSGLEYFSLFTVLCPYHARATEIKNLNLVLGSFQDMTPFFQPATPPSHLPSSSQASDPARSFLQSSGPVWFGPLSPALSFLLIRCFPYPIPVPNPKPQTPFHSTLHCIPLVLFLFPLLFPTLCPFSSTLLCSFRYLYVNNFLYVSSVWNWHRLSPLNSSLSHLNLPNSLESPPIQIEDKRTSGGEASKLKPRPRRTLPSAVIVGSSGKPRVTLQCLGTPPATSVLNTSYNLCQNNDSWQFQVNVHATQVLTT